MTRRMITAVLLVSAAVCFPSSDCLSGTNPYQKIKDAQTYLDEGAYDKAEQNCREVLESNPRLFPAYNILGIVYSRRRGGQRQAISYFERSLALYGDQPQVYNEIAALYNRVGDTEKAIEYLERGLERDPRDFQLGYNLALMYLVRKHDPGVAAEMFSKLSERSPEHAKLMFITGFSYILAGDQARALKYVTRLRALKEEYLASRLEELMRDTAAGRGIDMTEVMGDYASDRD